MVPDPEPSLPPGELLEALVTRIDARGCEVVPDGGGAPRFARVRGRVHRIGRAERSPLAPGDRVAIRVDGEESVVERVLPRRSRFSRESAEAGRPQIVAANLDLVLALLPAADPPPNPRLADRVLTVASHEGVEGVVVLSKVDLVPPGEAADLEGIYRAAGVRVIPVSVVEGRGLEEVLEALRGRTSVLVGPSGAGKSTLLKAILGPAAADIRTGAVNVKTGKGRHTTTASRLLAVPGGGWVVDTPGVRTLALPNMRAADLALHFPEVARQPPCRFADCSHTVEPGCAVEAAAKSGDVDPRRLESYRAMLRTMREKEARR